MFRLSSPAALVLLAFAGTAIAGGPMRTDLQRVDTGSIETAPGVRAQDPAIELAWPVCTTSIVGFGYGIHPFTGRMRFHVGVDLIVELGTEVRAAKAGIVTASERRGPYGLMMDVDHGEGVVTRYAQLQETLAGPRARVDAGQVIARAGSSGLSSGPHLHFEVWFKDNAYDPRRFLRPADGCAGPDAH